MRYDAVGQAWCTSAELCDLLYKNPDLDITNFLVEDGHKFNHSVRTLFAEIPLLKNYTEWTGDVDEFHNSKQNTWLMPAEYRELDIAAWLLSQCTKEAELQRVGKELLLYQERDLFNLLRFMKYLVDTLRKNQIVWGVGRGSSVASYVLYLIGVHKINSLYYDLDIQEFLK